MPCGVGLVPVPSTPRPVVRVKGKAISRVSQHAGTRRNARMSVWCGQNRREGVQGPATECTPASFSAEAAEQKHCQHQATREYRDPVDGIRVSDLSEPRQEVNRNVFRHGTDMQPRTIGPNTKHLHPTARRGRRRKESRRQSLRPVTKRLLTGDYAGEPERPTG